MKTYLSFFILLLAATATAQYERQGSLESQLKEVDSRFITKELLFKDFQSQVEGFTKREFMNEMVIDQSIPDLQKAVIKGDFSYVELTLFYLDRIYRYDRENERSLNSVLSLNPEAIEQAAQADRSLAALKATGDLDQVIYSLLGMPILLKDNIDVARTATTAGAVILKDHKPEEDAPIVANLRATGAVILGKANLSEWAYYFCGECPSGYSAMGGQTLNPYGRKIIDTGGSSSGSGVSVAANFAVAAVGTETAGSILSPASQNSVVGMKPTVGTLSGQGIIPISSYLDTAGPISKSVVDNAILFKSLLGSDNKLGSELNIAGLGNEPSLEGKRFGIYEQFMSIDLYMEAINNLQELGAETVTIEVENPDMPNFLTILNADMQRDLPKYFKSAGVASTSKYGIEKLVEFNNSDPKRYMLYGQRLFNEVANDKTTDVQLGKIKMETTAAARAYFTIPAAQHRLDGFLSINNYTAAAAAMAHYPAITVPMGYVDGVPFGLTFIAPSGNDNQLFIWAAAYESTSKKRVSPEDYKE
ncbi:MAG: amidase family protein [Nonlabens sp.]